MNIPQRGAAKMLSGAESSPGRKEHQHGTRRPLPRDAGQETNGRGAKKGHEKEEEKRSG